MEGGYSNKYGPEGDMTQEEYEKVQQFCCPDFQKLEEFLNPDNIPGLTDFEKQSLQKSLNMIRSEDCQQKIMEQCLMFSDSEKTNKIELTDPQLFFILFMLLFCDLNDEETKFEEFYKHFKKVEEKVKGDISNGCTC